MQHASRILAAFPALPHLAFHNLVMVFFDEKGEECEGLILWWSSNGEGSWDGVFIHDWLLTPYNSNFVVEWLGTHRDYHLETKVKSNVTNGGSMDEPFGFPRGGMKRSFHNWEVK